MKGLTTRQKCLISWVENISALVDVNIDACVDVFVKGEKVAG